MPDIFPDVRRTDSRSEQNVAVSAWRTCADALFSTRLSGMLPYSQYR
jgi:hypothetical protein